MQPTKVEPAGYLSPDYAGSFSEFGVPRLLKGCRGWILKRQIPERPEWDAMGCYPLFTCEDWPQLRTDLDGLDGEIVSLSLVTDPFGEYSESYLRKCFESVVFRYKEHFVTDLRRPIDDIVDDHHFRNAKKGKNLVKVEVCDDPTAYADDWITLYAALIERHNISGIATFSRAGLAQQLGVPGMVLFRAVKDQQTVGMLLWYVQGTVAYYHLGAYSDHGYRLRASFALFWYAIEYFADTAVEWLALGAGSGDADAKTDGLTRFKRGWATGTRPVYFCGRIYDQACYTKLARRNGTAEATFFPAYRAPAT